MVKRINSSMRERNRYIVFEISSDGRFGRKDVVDALWSNLVRLYGEIGASETSMWVMDWIRESGRGILKVNHSSVSRLKTTISSINELGGRKAAVNVLRISGTLKKARSIL